jgi:hypothetical protein
MGPIRMTRGEGEGLGHGRNDIKVGPTHQEMAENACPNGSVSFLSCHQFLVAPDFRFVVNSHKNVNQWTLQATNGKTEDFCDFKFFWLFCKLCSVMWWSFEINSATSYTFQLPLPAFLRRLLLWQSALCLLFWHSALHLLYSLLLAMFKFYVYDNNIVPPTLQPPTRKQQWYTSHNS